MAEMRQFPVQPLYTLLLSSVWRGPISGDGPRETHHPPPPARPQGPITMRALILTGIFLMISLQRAGLVDARGRQPAPGSVHRSKTHHFPVADGLNQGHHSREAGRNENHSHYSHPRPNCHPEAFLRSLRSRFPRNANLEAVRLPTGEFVNISWPVKRVANIEGSVVLGGLMMVHEREEKATCGKIMRQGGVQAMEAMLYTIDYVNTHLTGIHAKHSQNFLPNVTLGAYILDDCDKDTYGLEMAVDFIKGSISSLNGEGAYRCTDGNAPSGPAVKVIPGVIGAASSVTSIQVANLLRLFKIPQISFFSTSSELSNKDRFEYFSRTVPSDANQTRAMVDLVKLLNWTYISIIYEESAYGIQAFAALQQLLEDNKICLAAREKLPKDSGKAGERHYDELVERLKLTPEAKGVIVYGSDQEVAELMRSIRRRNATGWFTWIGSDGWSARPVVSDGSEPQVEGTLSFQPMAHPVDKFDHYFKQLTVYNNKRNPWFVEYWEDMFQCKFIDSPLTPNNAHLETECTGDEEYQPSGPFQMQLEPQLQFVSDAVMAFAHALHLMHQELCHGRPGLCAKMQPIDGAALLRYLRKVKFVGLTKDEFEFDQQGDGPARYNIVHFKRLSNLDPPQWGWVNVGEYDKRGLRLDWPEVRFNDRITGAEQKPESVCGKPCAQGQAKNINPERKCCWTCVNCSDYQYLASESECIDCGPGRLPLPNKTGCYEIASHYLSFDSYWAVGVAIFACLGEALTILVIVVFLKFNQTTVVKASGRELSYVLLAGIMLCYSMTGFLLLKPGAVVCGVQMFGIGICFAICYSALLTKTNRIARIFQAGKRSARRPNFISPRSQLIICAGLVSIQIVIIIVYMAYSPPAAEFYYPTREDNVLVCRSHIDASYMIAFGYPILLLIICTVYAVLTRKIPEAFNESQHIGFTTYTTCIIWLAFVPIFFSTATNIPLRITTLCASISLSGTVSLICLFAPKVYIILFHPERNVRQSLMMSGAKYNATKTNTTSLISHTGSGASQSSIAAGDSNDVGKTVNNLKEPAQAEKMKLNLLKCPGPALDDSELKPFANNLKKNGKSVNLSTGNLKDANLLSPDLKDKRSTLGGSFSSLLRRASSTTQTLSASDDHLSFSLDSLPAAHSSPQRSRVSSAAAGGGGTPDRPASLTPSSALPKNTVHQFQPDDVQL
ncbi:metabotropic glutamate receptor 2-like [Paramacrobiotus metropolitanus]|uniref:metabotropic glutamate receptor 2-like n=1 Tax=Paramacrobiotus metropolitanus TaxID=2943436 RepID=UPI002445DD04|nr:metabotropic glutamate receptor 2-like [Paramacrobiotus metropolitanus]